MRLVEPMRVGDVKGGVWAEGGGRRAVELFPLPTSYSPLPIPDSRDSALRPHQYLIQQLLPPPLQRRGPAAFGDERLQMAPRTEQTLGQGEPRGDRGDFVAQRGELRQLRAGERSGNRHDVALVGRERCVQYGEQFLAQRAAQGAQSAAALGEFVLVLRRVGDQV